MRMVKSHIIRNDKNHLKGTRTDWDINMDCLVWAYRATPKWSTTLNPYLMLLGREIRLPNEVLKGGIPLPSDGTMAEWLTLGDNIQ